MRAALRSPYPWIALAIPLVVTLAGWQVLWRDASGHAAQDFERRRETAEAALRARLVANEQALVAGSAFVAASRDAGRAQWADFVARLKLAERYPGLQSIGFAERVRAADRERHVKRMRADGLPDYDIRPPGERDDYVVIVFNEPSKGRNARMVGLDTYSQEILRAAILRSFETGAAAVSERAMLPDDEERVQPGFVMYMPAFRPGLPLSTPAERDAALLGFVVGTFRAKDLAGGVLDRGLAQDVGLTIYDGTLPKPEALLADLREDASRNTTAVFQRNASLDVGGRKWTAVISSDPRFDARAADTISLGVLVAGLLMSAAIFYLTLRLVGARAAVADIALRDTLTQLFNARYFEEAMHLEVQRAKRAKQPYGLVMLEIDNLKKIADAHGSKCSDQVLMQFASMMEKNTRASDVRCRLGGGEFAIGMPAADLANAKARAERLREVLESLALQCAGQPIGTVTLSAGVAVFPEHGEDWGSLHRRAHRALYAAKEGGRNRVAVAQ